MNRLKIFSLLVVWLFLLSGVALWADPTVVLVYKTVKDYGKVADLRKRLPNGDSIDEAADGVNGYDVRRVEIRDEGHLLSLLGGSDESKLSDTQKGLLEVYRMATTGKISELNQYGPPGSRKITINLVDVTGCGDRQKFPAIRNDYWPRAAKSITTTGNTTTTTIDVIISGVDSEGSGVRTAREMTAMFAHEYGHTLDKTMSEFNPYGADGHHWQNEVIKERSAFVEGFANFVQILTFPDRARDFRDGLYNVQYEGASGEYTRFAPTDPKVTPTDLLRIESVDALIFWRLARDLTDGKTKVMQAFQESNSFDNSLGKFLQTFIRLNPSDAYMVAQIVDEETRKRLSNEDLRTLFGRDYEIEPYLKARVDPASQPVRANPTPGTVANPPAQSTPTGGGSRVYKWKDKDGRLHFTDAPPPPDIPYTLMAPRKETKVQNEGENPFSEE